MITFSPEVIEKIEKPNSKKRYFCQIISRDMEQKIAGGITSLDDVRSFIFSFVILYNILSSFGISVKLIKEVRELRNSVAHLDERIESFDFKPLRIKSLSGVTFSSAGTSVGNIKADGVDISIGVGYIDVLSPFGLINDTIFWIGGDGTQKQTKLSTLIKAYKDMLVEVK